jgi:hypothetical protein
MHPIDEVDGIHVSVFLVEIRKIFKYKVVGIIWELMPFARNPELRQAGEQFSLKCADIPERSYTYQLQIWQPSSRREQSTLGIGCLPHFEAHAVFHDVKPTRIGSRHAKNPQVRLKLTAFFCHGMVKSLLFGRRLLGALGQFLYSTPQAANGCTYRAPGFLKGINRRIDIFELTHKF